MTERTQPRPRFPKNEKEDPHTLAAGRYGTYEMCDIWGPEKTFQSSLDVQGVSASVLSELHPEIVPSAAAAEITEKASLKYIKADRIRELEAKTGHDVIAINTSLEEVVSHEAGTHINKAKTSADTTETARALQVKKSLEVIAGSVENLRDIVLEKAKDWIDVPHMDLTHRYDALPSVAGRALVHYAEMLQSGLRLLNFVYQNSIVGKWADATGNHHSAVTLGIDGIRLQEAFCDRLHIAHMDAPAQIPGLEFQADVVYTLARLGETMSNLAEYIATGRGDDQDVFVNASPRKQKGSSAMPHKDRKNGNPDIEEQGESVSNKLRGWLTTAMSNCRMPYARTLAASANMRIDFEDGFKFFDHAIRRLAERMYWLDIDKARAQERVVRSYGAVTSQQIMTYLTDRQRTSEPMTRSQAHDLLGRLATEAWNSKTQLLEVVLREPEITRRLDETTLRRITDPTQYIGQSKEIIRLVAGKYHGLKTLA